MAARIPSVKQQRASRTNGKKSKGPVTKEGKNTVCRNASFAVMEKKFGLASPIQDREMGRILFGLMQDLSPEGLMQTLLVERIATFLWKLRRLNRVEMQLLSGEIETKSNTPIRTDPEGKVLMYLLTRDDPRCNQPKPEKSGEEIYLQRLMMDDGLIERLQSYELKLQKCLHASLRELRRMKKAVATDEARIDTDEGMAADERGWAGISDEKGEMRDEMVGGRVPAAQKSDQIEPENGKQIDQIEPESREQIDQIEPGRDSLPSSSVAIRAPSVAKNKSVNIGASSVAKNALAGAIKQWLDHDFDELGEWFEKVKAVKEEEEDPTADLDPVILARLLEEERVMKERFAEEKRRRAIDPNYGKGWDMVEGERRGQEQERTNDEMTNESAVGGEQSAVGNEG